MKKSIISQSALLLPMLLGLALTTQASVTPILTMDEVSSTTLTYTWNGGPVQTVTANANTPDYWQFAIIDDVVSSLPSTQNVNLDFEEPDYATSGEVNFVNMYQYGAPANGTTITVTSDTLPNPNRTYPLIVNGGTYDFYNQGGISGGNLVTLTDTAEIVPEPSPVQLMGVALLGMSLFGMVAIRRKLAQ